MNTIQKSVAIALGSCLFSSAAMADSSMPNPWTDCGIGALIFSELDEPVGQILAAISNITWDLGTTAVSSATTSPATCAGVETTAALFVHQNLKQLEEQTAIGTGEHLAAVLDIYGCQTEPRPELVSELRIRFSALIQEGTYNQAVHQAQAEAYWTELNSLISSSFSDQCIG